METTDKPVVLTMDDNRDQREILEVEFQALGHRTMAASTVGGAIAVIYDNPDTRFVVIADMQMRINDDVTNSLEFIRHVRQALAHRVFLIVYTGMASLILEELAIEAGALVVLHKTVDDERLKIYVKKAETFLETLRASSADSLTGLSNKKSFRKRVEYSLSEARSREIPTPPNYVSLVIVDLQQFKLINDTYGHLVGDEALQRVAAIIRKIVRQVDIIARPDGDEFYVYLHNVDSVVAAEWGKKIAELVSLVSIIDRKNREVRISVWYGIGTLTLDEIQQGHGLDELFERADMDETHGLTSRRNKTRALEVP